MKSILNILIESKANNKKQLAILIDPDKINLESIELIVTKIEQSPATHIFVGGSRVSSSNLDALIVSIRSVLKKNLPILLFPGDPSQISKFADGILFLSLLSGRNPDYLIEHQVNAVPILNQTNLEVIPTGYILIDGGSTSAVEVVSQTNPLDRQKINYIVQTAQAGAYLGNQLIYLEAGSGAKMTVPLNAIKEVAQKTNVPLIVGGGIRSKKEIEDAFNAGADLVVIGTAFENNNNFFLEF